jgi:predicted nucleic acid-binding protein
MVVYRLALGLNQADGMVAFFRNPYLALALRYGAILLTADQQLAIAAGRTGCGG